MSAELPRCPHGGKRSHRSKAAANRVLRRTRVAESKAKSAYKCPNCPYWHLTKLSQTPLRKGKKVNK